VDPTATMDIVDEPSSSTHPAHHRLDSGYAAAHRLHFSAMIARG